MIEREVAWRVFAHEFNHSDHFFHEGDERSPNYLVTPTGAKVNRLYFVGVLTEIDNIGTGDDMWRGRVSDPTGAFTVYAGQYQPDAAVFLSGLDIPSFVAVVGKARTYEPEEGTTYTSVRPEELNTADGDIRDRWIVDTARLTFERIRLVRTALGSGLTGKELVDMLVWSGASEDLADGICRAIGHYTDLEQTLNELHAKVMDTLRALLPADQSSALGSGINTPEVKEGAPGDRFPIPHSEHAAPAEEPGIINPPEEESGIEYSLEAQHPVLEEPGNGFGSKRPAGTEPPETEDEEPDAEEEVYELMGMMDKGIGVLFSDLMDEGGSKGLTEEQVEDAVKALMSDGRCYEPKLGVLRRV